MNQYMLDLLKTNPPCAHVVNVSVAVERDRYRFDRVGIAAQAEIGMNIGTADRPFIVTTTLRSPGIWDVDIDYEDAIRLTDRHAVEIYEEECETLVAMLATLGLHIAEYTRMRTVDKD